MKVRMCLSAYLHQGKRQWLAPRGLHLRSEAVLRVQEVAARLLVPPVAIAEMADGKHKNGNAQTQR